MGKEVETLRDHANPGSNTAHDTFGVAHRTAVDAIGIDRSAINIDCAFIDWFEVVNHAKERAFSRSTRADYYYDLALVNLEIDTAQYMQLSEALVNALEPDQGLVLR